MTRRGDRVPRPAAPGEWDVFAADSTQAIASRVAWDPADAGRGWDELCRSHPAAARAAFDALARDPRLRTRRQHPLQGSLGMRAVGGRVWYCIDDDKQRVWITRAGAGHPKATE
jgi:hypothetical protein